MSRIAIIPARGGSKRIPRKNIKPFLGKEIIAYSIQVALDSGLFDEVMVSTDDQEIADIAIKYGASVPFFRSNEKSDDFATLAEVLLEVLRKYDNNGERYDTFCCILPTAPFVTVEHIMSAFKKLENGSFKAVFPVVRFSYPIQRALVLNNKKIELMFPKYENSRSQDLPLAFHDSGQFYVGDTETFFKEKTVFTANTGMIELSEIETQDIDTEDDWRIAELKYKILNSPA